MRNIQLICCSFILLSVHGITYSQSTRTGTYTVLVTPQASLVPIGTDALASGGASVTEMGLATAVFTNPAGIRYTGVTAYAEFGKYTTSTWAADFDYNGQFVVPSFVSLGMPLGGMSISLSYFRQYSNRLNSGPIQITTPSFPEGTGEVIHYESSMELHSLCGSASIGLNNNISLGLTVGGNYFSHNEELGDISMRGSDAGLFIIGGVDLTFCENITAGAAIRYNWSMKYVPETNLSHPDLSPVGAPNPVRLVALETPAVEIRFPPIFDIGVSWQALSSFKLMVSAEFQNWTSALHDAENRWQLHLGGVMDLNEAISFRLGYFTLSNSTRYNRDILGQNFITAGLQLKIKPVAISLAFMDSHLFKKSLPVANTGFFDETFAQTYLSSGISFEF